MENKIFEDIEIYGFSGKLGTGKNYIAERIFSKMLHPKPTVVLAFADQIKIDGITKKGLDRDKCWNKKDKETRMALQKIGTEEGRDVFGNDCWTKNIKEWIIMHILRGIKRVIITDVRFYNEFDFIKSIGGTLIKVHSPKRNEIALRKESEENGVDINAIKNHRSEIELDSGRLFDYTIYNDEEYNAPIQVREVIKDLQSKRRFEQVFFCDLDNTICECNEYYINISNRVNELIFEHITPCENKEIFDKLFKMYTEKHHGDYSQKFFYIEKFADSLILVLEEFKTMFKSMDTYNQVKAEVMRLGMSVFNYDYTEIEGRISQLRELSKRGKVVIYTMGDRFEQVKKISNLGLTDFDFEVYDFKDATVFRNLMHKYPAEKYCMIGDSLERDILPAIEAGVDHTYLVVDKKESYWYKNDLEKAKHEKIKIINDLTEI